MHQEISTSLFFVSLKGLFSAFSSFHKGSNAIAERQLMIFLGAISYTIRSHKKYQYITTERSSMKEVRALCKTTYW